MPDHVSITRLPDGVALLTLDSRSTAMNVVSPDWLSEMESAVDEIAADKTCVGAVITSAKPTFMAGADLKHILAWCEAGVSEAEALAYSERATVLHRRIETSGQSFVAAINGLALGGGFELALACHARAVADAHGVVVGLPEVTVGLLPGSGGTQRLARITPPAVALDLLLSGRAVKPKEALNLGIIDIIAPTDALIERAAAWVRANPGAKRSWDQSAPEHGAVPDAPQTHPKYPAQAAIVRCVREGIALRFDDALALESREFARLLTGPVARNIIRTQFVNKGLAEKGARRPEGFEKRCVTRIGVLGAGMMGAGIAHVSACAGMDVTLIDIADDVAERGKDHSARLLGKDVDKGKRTRADRDNVLARIHTSSRFDDLERCELVVEAIFENKAAKAEVTRKAEAAVVGEFIFASNTSTLPITGLAAASRTPESFIGLHFFSPVERMALVEVIVGKHTSPQTLAWALDFVAQLRKTPIVVNDSRGFYTSRVFQTYIHEGMALLQEGVSPRRIEDCAVAAGMPIGPLALLDEVTLELPMKIVREAEAELGATFKRPVSYDVMRRMLDEFHRPGRKAGGGFYEYDGKGKALWRGLAAAFPEAASQPNDAEIEARLLYIQALEAARCFEEGVLSTAADADLGSVLGWNFPIWTGGTLSLIDTIGASAFVTACIELSERCGERFAPSPWLRQRAAAGLRFHESA
ncbi:enoyl-CoA hydratase [alpha proteobacterium U9-1i]|nr:enoyl-CoA hydratase [alpha proteobacterium U9-1i]